MIHHVTYCTSIAFTVSHSKNVFASEMLVMLAKVSPMSAISVDESVIADSHHITFSQPKAHRQMFFFSLTVNRLVECSSSQVKRQLVVFQAITVCGLTTISVYLIVMYDRHENIIDFVVLGSLCLVAGALCVLLGTLIVIRQLCQLLQPISGSLNSKQNERNSKANEPYI